MSLNFLDFERPIAELEAQIDELRLTGEDSNINISEEVERLQKKSKDLTKKIFSDLSAWQVAQLARHPQRPYTRDYIEHVFEDFDELAGDRAFSDDASIVGGLARLEGKPCVVIGHQKGRDTKAKIKHNFGMSRPEGYRKAKRLMEMAERFKLPVFTFIDTPGAFPGVGAEERGQSEAIARNLKVMATLKSPIIATVIGEGGSGGALALGVTDRILMLEHSVYSVISPEGCAAILWRSAEHREKAATALRLTSKDLMELGICDEVIDEPLGGAHTDWDTTAERVGDALERHLHELSALSPKALLEGRWAKYAAIGVWYEA